MNILPKKRWHVRTRDNIARVRRDEAQAAEEEKQRIQRAKLGEQEARTAYLRNKARERFDGGHSLNEDEKRDLDEVEKKDPNKDGKKESTLTNKVTCDIYTSEGNINFFKDIEADKKIGGTNKEYEKEKKEEQEKYEKQIGLLTYLGQDSLESQNGGRAWYENNESKVTLRKEDEDEEVGLKSKNLLDPIHDILKYSSRKVINTSTKIPSENVEKHKNVTVKDTIEKRQKKKKKVDKHKKHKQKKSKDRNRKKHKRDKQNVKIKKSCKRKRGSDSESDDRKYIRKPKKSKSSVSNYSSDSDNEVSFRSDKKHKKRHSSSNTSKSSSSSSDSEYEREQKMTKVNLEALRDERLKREEKEKKRAERLLAGKDPDEVEIKKPIVKQKYSSQFNPEIARQNKEGTVLKAGIKYWQQ